MITVQTPLLPKEKSGILFPALIFLSIAAAIGGYIYWDNSKEEKKKPF